jgi:hypothetical protein
MEIIIVQPRSMAIATDAPVLVFAALVIKESIALNVMLRTL